MSSMPDAQRPTITCPVSLPRDSLAVAELARCVSPKLGLGEPYAFPTAILDKNGVPATEDLVWCADGWTPDGVSIRLLVSPDRCELVFGNELRPRRLRAALQDLLRGGRDTRLASLDRLRWEQHVRVAVTDSSPPPLRERS